MNKGWKSPSIPGETGKHARGIWECVSAPGDLMQAMEHRVPGPDQAVPMHYRW